MKPFWHRLSLQQQRDVYENGTGIEHLPGLLYPPTVDEFVESFRQPLWCTYPKALQSTMGCWSLVYIDKKRIRTERDCKDCDCHKDKDGA